jgi:hypothetical protein
VSKLITGVGIGVALLILSAILSGLPIGLLLNPAALIMVLGPLVGVVWLVFPAPLIKQLLDTLSGQSSASEADCRRIERACVQFGDMAVLSAVIGLAVIGVHALGTGVFTEPADTRRIGAVISGAAACLVYGISCKIFLAMAIESAVASRRLRLPAAADPSTNMPTAAAEPPPRGLLALMAVTIMLVSWLYGFWLLSGRITGFITASKLLLVISIPLLLGWMAGRPSQRSERPAGFVEAAARQAGAAAAAGVVATIIGVMAVAISDNPSRISVGLAGASLGMTYGLMGYFMLRALGLRGGRNTESG